MRINFKNSIAVAVAGLGLLALRPASGAIVINEVYGGGGNAGAPYTHDFIELYNNGASTVDISGYLLQYVTATGTFAAPSATDGTANTIIPASTNLAAGAFYLIQEDSNAAVGSALPSPNLVDSTPIVMAATAGNVRLRDGTTGGSAILDTIGYGAAAVNFEGTGPAPAPSATNSDQRVPNGSDLEQNATDFKTGGPTPGATNVPEPLSLSLLGFGLLAAGIRRRR